MLINEAIGYCGKQVQALYDDINYMVTERGITETDKEYQDAMEEANNYRQIQSLLNELKRLTGLEAHSDTYESEGESYFYHEMAGINTITIRRRDGNDWHSYTLDKPLTHEQFVDWCQDDIGRRKNDDQR